MESSGDPIGTALEGGQKPALARALRELLRASHTIKASQLAPIANRVMRPLGLDLVIFVVDYEQQTLRPLPEGSRKMPTAVMIDGSLAGRAFQTISIQPVGRPPHRLWIPIVDGTSRLGVLAVDLPSDMDGSDPSIEDELRAVAGLVGHLLQAKGALGDTVEAARRSAEMTVASELLLRLVPPSTFVCDQLALSVVLEPSYDVGGDGYDYSVDDTVAKLAVLDALGRGMPAALTFAAAISALRAARRVDGSLAAWAEAADDAITGQWDDARFATAVLAEINLDTGRIRYLNAGHPPPALIRGGRVVQLLDKGRRMPLGLGDDAPEPGELRLEPGDRLLLYTDGVTEARGPDGALFGLDRLVALTERHAASHLPTAEILRRLSHAVLDHQAGHLRDDATLMLVEWESDAARRALP